MTCNCDRREFLHGALGATLAFALHHPRQDSKAKARACILVWLDGGPSHIDTFDPKEGVEATKGDIRIAAALPGIANELKHLSLVRSLTSGEADHGRAQHLLHTGYAPQESVEYPSAGAYFARELAKEEADLPAFVTVGSRGWGAGLLGELYAPFILDAPGEQPAILSLPEGIDKPRFRRRLDLLNSFDRNEDARKLRDRAARYMRGPLKKALNLESEKERDAWGKIEDQLDPFGQACLQARRLIEAGVSFVEVTLDGWDMHENLAEQIAKLNRRLDAGLSSLARDLRERGLLDSTLLLCVGEFGRTPEINEQKGRDHHSKCFSAVVGGGGLRGGIVVGKTDAKGEEVADRPVTVPEFWATIYRACGIDLDRQYYSPEGRPIRIIEKGTKPVGEFF